MQVTSVKRSVMRLAAIVAVVAGLILSNSVASARPGQIGVRECDQHWCVVVTIDDLKGQTRSSQIVDIQSGPLPSGRYDHHFTR